MEEKIFEGLKTGLMKPDLFEIFAAEFVAEWNRLRRERNGEADAATSRLLQIEPRIDRLVNAIADGADALSLNAKI